MTRSEIVIDSLNNSKYTIQQWSQILGVTRDTIHKWLTGVNNPKRATVNHIAEVLGKQALFSEKNEVSFSDTGSPTPDFDFGKKTHAPTGATSAVVDELVAQVQYLRNRVQELEGKA